MIDTQGIPSIWEELKRINASLAKICPYTVGDLYITVSAANPATTWVGTTWEKVEGAVIRATSGSEAATVSKSGSDTVTLGVNHMPVHNHPASGSSDVQGWHGHNANHGHSAWQDAHAHTQPSHNHATGRASVVFNGGNGSQVPLTDGNYGGTYGTTHAGGDNTGGAQPTVYVNATNFDTAGSGSHSHNIGVSVGNAGGGAAFSVLPVHIKAHVWRRLT